MNALPELFVERIKRIIPADKQESVLGSFERKLPVAFRIHKAHTNPVEIEADLVRQGFELETIPWYTHGWILKNKDIRSLQETSAYKENQIYIQGLSSLFPPIILDVRPNETVLDMAAAPGSKATQIALMMQGKGRLHLNEKVRSRFFKLKANIDAQGFENVELHLRTGAWFGRFMPEAFDRILLDAPCSSEGRFSLLNPKTYEYWKIHKVRESCRKQKRLLKSALNSLKPGGFLVYSTCTFSPEENENVLHWALRKYEGQFELLDFDLPVDNYMNGLTSWKEKEYNPEVRKAKRILPNEIMDGFFIALIRKL